MPVRVYDWHIGGSIFCKKTTLMLVPNGVPITPAFLKYRLVMICNSKYQYSFKGHRYKEEVARDKGHAMTPNMHAQCYRCNVMELIIDALPCHELN